MPANIVAEATGPSGAAVTYSGKSATDLVDGSVPVTCLPASGSTFPLGVNTVTCTATDAAGNPGSNSFTITVQDTTPPVVTVPADITVKATSPSGAVVTFTASAADLVDGPVTVTCLPTSGSTFPIGTTTVICSATDSHNNSASKTFNITVQYTLLGFYQPVDISPSSTSIVWKVKGGSTVPLKFEVFAGTTELTNTSIVSGFAKQVTCNGGTEDTVEVMATGGTSLRYDTVAGQFIYNWQTPKLPGKCYMVTMTTLDGSTLSANFKLK